MICESYFNKLEHNEDVGLFHGLFVPGLSLDNWSMIRHVILNMNTDAILTISPYESSI